MQEALDVWSLGVMAFELLTGKPALNMFEAKDNVRTLPLQLFFAALSNVCNLEALLQVISREYPSRVLTKNNIIPTTCHTP
jgi:serine/threonine protein kinase